MKIIFFGTSDFAVPGLKALASSGHEISLVVTQPDRKKGRHLKLSAPPVKEAAKELGLPLFQTANISNRENQKELRRHKPDLIVVVSFGQLLSEEVLSIPKKFAINLHASVLPKYRGAAPINWALINGDSKTGVCTFRIVKKMDAGDVILRKEINITYSDDAITLSDKLSKAGAEILMETIELIEKNKAVYKRQNENSATYAPVLKKADGQIDWNLQAVNLHNRVRGLVPWPGAYTKFNGKILKVLETSVNSCHHKGNGKPGEVVGIEEGNGILVQTSNGCLTIKKLQQEGSKPMDSETFLRGHKLPIGTILG